HHAGAAERLVEQRLHQHVVLGWPVPALGQPPAVDDVTDKIDLFRLVPAQEVDELRDPRGAHAEMHVGKKQCPDAPYPPAIARLSHPCSQPVTGCRWWARRRSTSLEASARRGNRTSSTHR